MVSCTTNNVAARQSFWTLGGRIVTGGESIGSFVKGSKDRKVMAFLSLDKSQMVSDQTEKPALSVRRAEPGKTTVIPSKSRLAYI